VCVECLIGKQKKPILFKVTEPSSVPYRAPPACAKMAAYPDPPPVILVPESIAAQGHLSQMKEICLEKRVFFTMQQTDPEKEDQEEEDQEEEEEENWVLRVAAATHSTQLLLTPASSALVCAGRHWVCLSIR